jgi:hypothetical protein
MSDIFGGVEPPAWLSRIAQPADMSVASKVVGELVGGLGISAEKAIKSARDKQEDGIATNWIKEMPANLHDSMFEARMNLQNPMWKQQVQQAQLNMAETQMRMQDQQSIIDTRKNKMVMLNADKQNFSQFMQDHPTWESRQSAVWPAFMTPEMERAKRDAMMADSRSVQAKVATEGVHVFSKEVGELGKIDPKAAAKYSKWIGHTDVPQEVHDQFAADMAGAQEAARKKLIPTAEVIGGQKGVVTAHGAWHADPQQAIEARAKVEEAKEARKEAAKSVDELRRNEIAEARNEMQTAYAKTLEPYNLPTKEDPTKGAVARAQYKRASDRFTKLQEAAAKAGPAAPAKTGPDVVAMKRDALTAIGKGADKAAVAKRYKELTGQDLE